MVSKDKKPSMTDWIGKIYKKRSGPASGQKIQKIHQGEKVDGRTQDLEDPELYK